MVVGDACRGDEGTDRARGDERGRTGSRFRRAANGFSSRAPNGSSDHDLGSTEEIHDVGKVSLGARREFPLGDRVRLGLGALYSLNDPGSALEPTYGGNPDGAMIFLQFTAGT